MDFPWAWLPTLEPEYVELAAKHYYQCHFEGCSFSNSGKAAIWSHVSQTHSHVCAHCLKCTLESLNLESLRKHMREHHPDVKLAVKTCGQTKQLSSTIFCSYLILKF